MPARRVRSARRRWGPGSSLVRSCAARLLLLMLVTGRMLPVIVIVIVVVVVVVVLCGGAEARELAEGHRPLGDACTPDDPIDHLLLERGGLDLAHRVGVLQVCAPRFLRIRIALHQG